MIPTEQMQSSIEKIDAEVLGEPKKGGTASHDALASIPNKKPTTELLKVCQTWIQRFTVLSDSQLVVLAGWILHTWAIDAFDITPYLHITAPEKACGKTRLLEVLNALACRPWMVAGATAAVLVRKIDKLHPTLLLDESDAAFGGADEYTEALRGILNAGFMRNGTVSRCEGKGAEMSYKDFSCFRAQSNSRDRSTPRYSHEPLYCDSHAP
jgi:hypothetical protein